MPVFEAAEFACWVGGSTQALPPHFQGVVHDSRRVSAGCLYVAVRGERFDGHEFVGQALVNGAAAAMVEERWQLPSEAAQWPLIRVKDTRLALIAAAAAWRRRCRALIVGITGSSGKTTVKEMTAAMLRASGSVCATRGNLNNDLGLPLSILSMRDDDAFGVFEAGTNHPGEIAVLAATMRPSAAIITNIGCAHIEHFGSVEAIAREKGALLGVLPTTGFAVLSLECECFKTVAKLSPAGLVTVSLSRRDADFYGALTDPFEGVLSVVEKGTGEKTVLRSGLPGEHIAEDLLLAFAAARKSGIAAAAAGRKLEGLVLPAMRWSVSRYDGVTVVNDAYNANPQSMRAVISTFMRQPGEGRKILVLGDMLELGAQTETLHREIGRFAAGLAPDVLIAVGQAAGRYIAEEALKAGMDGSKVICYPDAVKATRARGWFRHGDMVLLKASRGVGLERMLDGWQV
ncbi:MAG: UDP-N-acetylmuramoyl-tripeptide--D-alanyl-D-alanine ligase [Kiritimatiellae bacterium]|nr:UDP-N-acetylmuramoyl-tripeptide--D-alanyl-D-alanine ligase [Kiritimatiellia bacterium]